MDGGSTDGSVDIIRRFAADVESGALRPRCEGIVMEWRSRPDQGQSHAINEGLRRASGDVASYLNSDDLYSPGALGRVAAEFGAHPEADFVYGDGDVIDETGRLQWEWLSRPYEHSVLTSYHFLWNSFTNYIPQQSTFWRRQVHERIGLLDEGFHYAMDVEYWVRAGAAGLTLRHVPAKLGRFRLIEGTKSRSGPTVFWSDYLEIFRRHRGARSLGRYFAYYWYNVGRAAGYDPDEARRLGEGELGRFDSLPEGERERVRSGSERGRRVAALLLATDLRKRGRRGEADRAFLGALRERPLLVLHPFAWRYVIQVALGPWLFARVERLARNVVKAYRRVRHDYRYRRWRRG
jgi:glycosyltransferase involved in cell wall biosynthesis